MEEFWDNNGPYALAKLADRLATPQPLPPQQQQHPDPQQQQPPAAPPPQPPAHDLQPNGLLSILPPVLPPTALETETAPPTYPLDDFEALEPELPGWLGLSLAELLACGFRFAEALRKFKQHWVAVRQYHQALRAAKLSRHRAAAAGDSDTGSSSSSSREHPGDCQSAPGVVMALQQQQPPAHSATGGGSAPGRQPVAGAPGQHSAMLGQLSAAEAVDAEVDQGHDQGQGQGQQPAVATGDAGGTNLPGPSEAQEAAETAAMEKGQQAPVPLQCMDIDSRLPNGS
ncbi:hypothetical protein VOLCADRAFT_108037 [Volvox carteri f. nagariensis]|uniref:Uncharacterized protein n=1 Tax=Volvox carteri f. nagariensis TaxID=3068 RepID=D8UHW5_VOLCA|nr:uncharacterized protein VOLCADRAFT_108037 [Volvox carteri f. nagariensis]EFJ40690.1 hypothetical protein VOLCADRAFT_108037 [Volvox carteri f. nagariensis]|eukprot:XP_002958236.1 hypothetical protein VOLCADRAFT_108037 [Volvox carteri f. nagariensis]